MIIIIILNIKNRFYKLSQPHFLSDLRASISHYTSLQEQMHNPIHEPLTGLTWFDHFPSAVLLEELTAWFAHFYFFFPNFGPQSIRNQAGTLKSFWICLHTCHFYHFLYLKCLPCPHSQYMRENQSYVYVYMLLLHALPWIVTEKGKLLSNVIFVFIICDASNKPPFNSMPLLSFSMKAE